MQSHAAARAVPIDDADVGMHVESGGVGDASCEIGEGPGQRRRLAAVHVAARLLIAVRHRIPVPAEAEHLHAHRMHPAHDRRVEPGRARTKSETLRGERLLFHWREKCAQVGDAFGSRSSRSDVRSLPGTRDILATMPIPSGTRIGAVHLTVSDLERSLIFYRQQVGFREVWRRGPSAGLGVSNRVLLVVHESPERSSAAASDDGPVSLRDSGAVETGAGAIASTFCGHRHAHAGILGPPRQRGAVPRGS